MIFIDLVMKYESMKKVFINGEIWMDYLVEMYVDDLLMDNVYLIFFFYWYNVKLIL